MHIQNQAVEAIIIAAIAKAGSQRALAQSIQVSERQVGRWARGENRPRPALIARILFWLEQSKAS